ncbi:MAG: hypothetical protein JXA99_07870 [Candidatus Lokiarchaeota archaeon]|nr:hypothetical protein [Candidatus Lokiarchaeota archaeon]
MNKKITLIIIILFLPILGNAIYTNSNVFNEQRNQIKDSGVYYGNVGIGYLNYYIFSFHLDNLWDVEWYIKSYTEDVGLRVLLMNIDNVKKFYLNNTDIKYYILFNGDKPEANGEHQIPYKDTWFIIFLNDDESEQYTKCDLRYGVDQTHIYYESLPTIFFYSLLIILSIYAFILKIKNNHVNNGLKIGIVFFLTFWVVYGNYINPMLIDIAEDTYSDLIIQDDLNFYITDDTLENQYNFPGNGTTYNPYLIENYTFFDYTWWPIEIDGISTHIIFKNCYFFRAILCSRGGGGGSVTFINNTCVGSKWRSFSNGMDITTGINYTLIGNTFINYYNTIIADPASSIIFENNTFIRCINNITYF